MKGAVFYNGATGSLGTYIEGSAKRLGIETYKIQSRLEDSPGLIKELTEQMPNVYPGGYAVLLQLAAMVSVPGCEKDPKLAHQTNVTDTVSTVNTFISAAKKEKLVPKIIYVSTGHIYAPKSGRILETDPIKPRSVYASTKLEAENELARLCTETKTPLTIARVFGLIAPKQPAHYVLQSVIRRARSKDLKDVPGLSNLRDYLDSRDVCMTLLRLASISATGIFNLCSGEGVEIAYLLETALKEIHPNEADSLINSITEGAARADDIPEIIGDPTKVENRIGRECRTISVEQTIRDAIHSR